METYFRLGTMLTLGIAIPCYKNHIGPLKNLLDSIERQTKKPDKVVISSSSTEIEDITYKSTDYSFPFTIITSSEKKNAAQNRNCAAAHLDTDIISFIDADDIIHYQRLQIIYNCFLLTNCKLVLHSFQWGIRPESEIEYKNIDFQKGVLYRSNQRVNHAIYNDPDIIVNGHSTIRKDIFNIIKYDESTSQFGREDTEFNLQIIDRFSDECYFINLPLMYYVQSRSQLKE